MEDLDSQRRAYASHTWLGVLEAARLDCVSSIIQWGSIRRVLGWFNLTYTARCMGAQFFRRLGGFKSSEAKTHIQTVCALGASGARIMQGMGSVPGRPT